MDITLIVLLPHTPPTAGAMQFGHDRRRGYRGTVGLVEGISRVGGQAGIVIDHPVRSASGRGRSTDMSSGPRNRTNTLKAIPAEQSLRLWTRPAAPITRDAVYVDGAWRPRARNLFAELPALFEALVARLGVIQRRAYNLTEWETGVGIT